MECSGFEGRTLRICKILILQEGDLENASPTRWYWYNKGKSLQALVISDPAKPKRNWRHPRLSFRQPTDRRHA
jgi:hypothetical protein